MLVALHRGRGVQIPPAAQPGAAQDATDRSRTEPGPVSDQIAGQTLTAQLDDLLGQAVGQTPRAAMRP